MYIYIIRSETSRSQIAAGVPPSSRWNSLHRRRCWFFWMHNRFSYMPTSYAGALALGIPWNSSNYTSGSSGPGSYVSGSSVRSASTSLDGVVAAWSASVDAASLLPGTCCICPESSWIPCEILRHFETLRIMIRFLIFSDIMKWTKWTNIWNASAAVRHLLFYLCGYCGLVEPVRTNALYQKPLAVAIRCDSLPRMDLLVHLILEQWIASTSLPWQHLALQPSVRWDIRVRPNSTQFDPQTSTKLIRIPQIFEAECFATLWYVGIL